MANILNSTQNYSREGNKMKELYTALIAFQKDIVGVGKTATNPFFKNSYVPLDELRKVTQPLLTAHKLGVMQFPSQVDGKPALRTVLVHESGESIEDTTILFLSKEDPQSQGSAITYMRRYAYMGILGLVGDEDDDGNKATQARKETRNRPQEVAGGAEPFNEEADTLGRAKIAINEQMEAQGYTLDTQKVAVIFDAIGKKTIDNLNDADAIADALDNLKDQ